MALTFEQFKKLRRRGLSVEKITEFSKREPEPQNVEKKEKTIFDRAKKIGEFGNKTFGKGGEFLFGSTGRTVGGLILSGIGRTKQLTAKEPEEIEKGRRLAERGEEQFTPKQVGLTALELLPGGGFLTQGLKRIKGGEKIAQGIETFTQKLPEKLRASAVEQFKSVLGATTKKFKGVSEKVAPELAERKVTAISRAGLEKKATKFAGEAGEQVGEFIEQIPKETTLKTKPILDAIEKTKKEFTIKGVVVEPEKLRVANELQDIVKQFGDELEADNIIKLRRVWDKTIEKAGKGFGLDAKDSFKLEVKKEATNAIRNELAKEFPDLAKINKEFAFWNNVKNTVGETLKRTAGKKSFAEAQAGRIGTGAGFIRGGIEDAILVGVAAKNFVKLTSSTAWKTMSAKKKVQLAEAIESGNMGKINEVIKRLLLGIEGEPLE